VALNAEVSITFNKNISTMVGAPNVTITKTGGENVGGVNYTPITPNQGINKLIINHNDFEYDSEYTVTIPTDVIAGWAEPIIWTFTTCSDPNVNDCNAPANFAVEYTEDCKAELSWDAPGKMRSEMLWNNTNADMSDNGLFACYWSGNDNWIVTADDFVADEAWVIEKIYSKGYPSGSSATPSKFSVVIYANGAGNIPGTEIYRNNAITVSDGLNPEINLPTPFTLPGAGTYWISIAGAYDVSVTNGMELADNRWNIASGPINIGFGTLTHNKQGIYWWPTTWTDPTYYLGDTVKSMYFTREGTK
jgi:hypothetical protein